MNLNIIECFKVVSVTQCWIILSYWQDVDVSFEHKWPVNNTVACGSFDRLSYFVSIEHFIYEVFMAIIFFWGYSLVIHGHKIPT